MSCARFPYFRWLLPILLLTAIPWMTISFVEGATVSTVSSGTWSGTAVSAWPLTNRTGTVTTTNSSALVTGVSTLFTTELSVGNIISTQGGVIIGTVAVITDNLHLTLLANTANVVSGATYRSNGVGSGDSAIILGTHTVSMDATNAVISAITMLTPIAANSSNLTVLSGKNLTVTNAITFNVNTSTNSQNVTLQGTGNLSAGSIVTSTSTGSGGTMITCAAGATGTLTVTGDISLIGSGVASSTGSRIDFGSASTACNVTAGSVHLIGGSVSAGLLKMGTGALTLSGILSGGGTAAKAQFTTTGAGSIILNGGTIAVGETLAINAGTSLTSTGSSSVTYATVVTTWGGLSINSGTLTYAVVAGTFSSITIAGGATLAPAAILLTNTGNYTNNGTHSGSGGMNMTGTNAVLDGSGIYSNTGNLTLNTAAKSFASTANLTIAGTLAVVGAITVTNNGVVNVTAAGGITGSVAGSTWVNAASSVLYDAGPLLAVGTLTATASGNTINYDGAAQTVKPATHFHLILSGSGVKTMTTVTTVNGNFISSGGTATAPLTTVGGNFIVSGGSPTLSASLVISGNVTVASGTLTTGGVNLTVDGATEVSGGTFTFTNNLGPKTMVGLVTVDGGFLTGASTSTFFQGGIAQTSGGISMTGVATFNTNNQALSGTINISTVVAATGITLTNNGGLTATSITATGGLVNNSTITVLAGGALTGGGSWTQGSNSLLTINTAGAAAMTVTTVDFTTNVNTVTYSGAAQTLKGAGYDFLSLSGSGAKTLTGVTGTLDDLSISGTATATTAAAMVIGGNLVVGAGTTFTTGSNYTLSVTGSTAVSGTLANTNTGAKTYDGVVTINSGGSWTNATNSAVTFGGGFINNTAGTISMGTGTHTFAGNQAIDGTSGITFGGAVTVNVSSTVTNNNNATVTITGTLTLNGNWTQSANSTLVLSGSTSGSGTMDGSANPNTVTFNGNGATVFCSAPGYYDLNLKPSGATPQVLCTAGSQTLTVADNLVIGDGANAGATGAANNPVITVGNNLTLAAKATLVAPSGGIATSGVFSNSGNFTFNGSEAVSPAPTNVAGSSITYTATSGTVPLLSTWTYRNLVFNGSGGTFASTGTLTVAENLTVTAGTLSVGKSTVTFTGTVGQRIDSQGTAFGTLVDSNTTATSGVIFASNFTAGTLYVNGAGLASATTIQFNAGGVFTITTLSLTGAANQMVTLRSTTGGSRWQLNNVTSNSVKSVDVKDSDASPGVTIQANDGSSFNALNNLNWFFGSSCNALTSTQSGNWSDTTVWDLGFAPTSCNAVNIASGHTLTVDIPSAVASSLTFASAAAANGVTVPNGDTLAITNAITFSINAAANSQTLTMSGSGSVSAASIVTSTSTSTGAAIITCASGATGTLTVSGDISLIGSGVASSNGSMIDFGTVASACNVTAGTVHLVGGTVGAGLLKMGTGVLTLNGVLNGTGTAAKAQLTTTGGPIVMNGGALGTGETLTIGAGTDLTSTGISSVTYATSITTWGDLSVHGGALTYSVVTATFTSITISGSGTLANAAIQLFDSGNYTNNGTHSGSAGMTMTGANAVLDGTGTYSNTGALSLNPSAKSIASTADLTVAGTLALLGAANFTNNGTVIITAATGMTGVAGATWINANGATLKDAGPLLATGNLTATASSNTIEYSGAAQTVKLVTYDHLTLSGSGAKTITGLATVNSDLVMGGSATATPTVNLAVGGDFDLMGTSAFTTANFTLGVTGNTTVAGTFTHSGTMGVTISGDLTVNGTMSGAGTGTITANGDVTGPGTISLTANTFEQRVAAAQNFGQTSGGNNWTFKNLTFSNSNVGATPELITTETGGNGGVLINTLLTVGKSGDTAGATTILDPADVVWTSSGTGVVFTSGLGRLCDPGTCPDNTSLFDYVGSAATVIGATTGYYDLVRNPIIGAPVTDTTPAGAITAYHSFKINPTKATSAGCVTMTLGGNLSVTTGALILTGTTFGCSVLNTSASNFAIIVDSLTIAQGPGTGATDALTANASTITLTDPGTPFTLGASLATFTRGSSTVTYTGNGAMITILAGTGLTNTYSSLALEPSGATPQILGAGTLDINGNLIIGDGTNSGATASGNPTINLYGDLTIAANAVYTKGAGTTTFKKGNVQTWTDNTTGAEDLGTVRVSANTTNTTVNLATSVQASAFTIDASQTVSLNGSNTLEVSTLANSGTLNGSSGILMIDGTGSPFTNTGTFTYGTGTVLYDGNGAIPLVLSGSGGSNGYYNLELEPSGASAQVLGTVAAQTIVVNNNLTVGDGTHAGATCTPYVPALKILGDTIIAAHATLTSTGTLTFSGDFTNSGAFSGTGSTVTFNGSSAEQVDSKGAAYAIVIDSNISSAGVTFISSFTAAAFTVNSAGLSSSATVYFQAGSTFTMTGLSFVGASGDMVWLAVDYRRTAVGSGQRVDEHHRLHRRERFARQRRAGDRGRRHIH